MRQHVPFGPIAADRWEAAGAQGIELLPLNQDPDKGARTALIRSIARPGFECRAQYHRCEEEFLCLAGLFTFDGVNWMRPLSYACYPPYVVHGARVSVPGGYLLYLRTSGSPQPYFVDEPVTNEAYHHPEAPAPEPIILLDRTLDPRRAVADDGTAANGIRRRVLRTQPATAAKVTLWEFPAGERDIFRHFPAAMPIEVLIAPAGADPTGAMDAHSMAYGCYGAGDPRPRFDTSALTIALVHTGNWA
jgi:hypothetical protein